LTKDIDRAIHPLHTEQTPPKKSTGKTPTFRKMRGRIMEQKRSKKIIAIAELCAREAFALGLESVQDPDSDDLDFASVEISPWSDEDMNLFVQAYRDELAHLIGRLWHGYKKN
jgi:hypothetical protein